MATAPAPIRTADDPAPLQQYSNELALIERIASSEAFQKSSRLPGLLRYLAACTLRGDRAALTEQAIGRAVFDKPADFHPTEDSSVRVYVRQLRLRLYEYFQSTGQDEHTVIEIPKGGYALSFHARHALEAKAEPEAVALPAQPAAVTASPRTHVSAWLPWALVLLALMLAAAGWLRWYRAASATLPTWPLNRVMEPNQPTTMVLADASYILRMLGDKRITLDEYADRKYTQGLIPQDATEHELRVFHYLQDAQITSMADARAVAAISSLAGSLRDTLVVRSAKEVSAGGLSAGNFIIVGASNSNPWEELFGGRVNFPLVEHGPHGGRYIDNRAPQPGEQPFYAVHENTGYSGEDYATISLVPGLGDSGSVLLIQGLRREGTEAAVVFLSSSARRKTLEARLRTANGGQTPQYFEALLKSHAVAGAATSIDCIAVRVLSSIKR